jgi:hypothetical protein
LRILLRFSEYLIRYKAHRIRLCCSSEPRKKKGFLRFCVGCRIRVTEVVCRVLDYESLAAASKKRGDEFLAFLPRTSHVYMYLVVFILSVLFQLYVSFRVGKEHSRPRSKITRPIYHLLIMCSNIISRLFGVSALLRRGHYGPPNFLRRANETREIGDSE